MIRGAREMSKRRQVAARADRRKAITGRSDAARDSRQLTLESGSATPVERPSPKASPSTPLPAAHVAMMAKRAISRRAPKGDPVTLALSLVLRRARWEALSAQAIREGRNLEDVVARILEGAATDRKAR